jgi:spore maturation protein CgeB
MFKKIIIYGEFWEGTLPKLLQDELLKKDIEVFSFDFTEILPGIKNHQLIQRVKRRLFEKYYSFFIRKNFLSYVRYIKPDCVIVVKGFHLSYNTLSKIRDLDITLINWNPDDFFNFKTSNRNMIDSIPLYDLIVSSRDHLFLNYEVAGARSLFYLDWYFVPEFHFDRKLSKNFDASFVGSWSPSRENFIGKLNKKFDIWGAGWAKSSKKFKNFHNVHNSILSQAQMSIVFNSSNYNLNLLTHDNSDYSNLRFFEITASNGLLLTERNKHSLKYLDDRKDCLMFSSADEVNQIFLENHDLNTIAYSGNQKILKGRNSFSNRIDDLIKSINQLIKSSL